MKFHRIESGVYESHDKRVIIKKEISQQTYHPDEVSWSVTIDGKALPVDKDTKRDAVNEAKRRLGL